MGGMARDSRELGGAWARFQTISYGEPSADLAPFVARYWSVCWDLRDQPPYRQLIVPYPNVHLTFTTGQPSTVTGVPRRRVVKVLATDVESFSVTCTPAAPYAKLAVLRMKVGPPGQQIELVDSARLRLDAVSSIQSSGGLPTLVLTGS